jgi:hypothetical protein
MDKIHSFASVAASMLDTQKALMHALPLQADGVTPAALPAGGVPSWTLDATTFATIDPTVDPTGLSCEIIGVKGSPGVATATVSFTNADGSVASGTVVMTITKNPAEIDVASFGTVVDAPVNQ